MEKNHNITIVPNVDELTSDDIILKRNTEKMPGTMRRYRFLKDMEKYIKNISETRKGIMTEEQLKEINPNLVRAVEEKEELTVEDENNLAPLKNIMMHLGKIEGEKDKSLCLEISEEDVLSKIYNDPDLKKDIDSLATVARQLDELTELSISQGKIIEEKNRKIKRIEKENEQLNDKLAELKRKLIEINLNQALNSEEFVEQKTR